MIFKNLKLKTKSSILTIFLILISQVASISNSNASEPCLSTIPDSAWANGQPSNLDLSKNVLIKSYKVEYKNISSTNTSIIYKNRIEDSPAFIFENGLKLQQISRQLGIQPNSGLRATYTYEGKNCLDRSVIVDFSADKIIKDKDLELLEKSLEGVELDYKTVNSIFKALQFIAKLTENSSTKKPFAIFPLNPDYSKAIDTDRNVVSRANVGLTGRIGAALKKSPNRPAIGYVLQNLSYESESNCITFGIYPDPYRGVKTTLALAPKTYLTIPNYDSLVFSSAQTCKLKVLYRVPSPQTRGLENYIYLGDIYVQGSKKVPKLVFYYQG